jgi:hypothetical protein
MLQIFVPERTVRFVSLGVVGGPMPGDHKSAKPAVIVQEVCHFLY